MPSDGVVDGRDVVPGGARAQDAASYVAASQARPRLGNPLASISRSSGSYGVSIAGRATVARANGWCQSFRGSLVVPRDAANGLLHALRMWSLATP